MTADLAVHLASDELDPRLPLACQPVSVRAEIDAAAVFVHAAENAVLAGGPRAFGRLKALEEHLDQLRQRLAEHGTTP